MSKNDFITIPTQDDMAAILNQNSSRENLNATAFAKHTGLATVNKFFPEDTAEYIETWLRNKSERDTVTVYQTNAKSRHAFPPREVDDTTVGVMPCLLNENGKPFCTATDQIGQTVLTINNGVFRYPQDATTPEEAADLDRLLASENKFGCKQVGTYTAPDTGRVMPCYRYRGNYYVQHTNKEGHTAWFRCDLVAVQPLNNDRFLFEKILFAAPFSSRQKFRERTQGVMANDELTMSQFALGRFLTDTFLPELIKSTTFGLTHPVDKIFVGTGKLSRLNVTLRNTEIDNTLDR